MENQNFNAYLVQLTTAKTSAPQTLAFDRWRKDFIATRGDHAYTQDGLGVMALEDYMYLPANMQYYEQTGRRQAIEALCYNPYIYLYEAANNYPDEFFITADGINNVSLSTYLNDPASHLPSTMKPATEGASRPHPGC